MTCISTASLSLCWNGKKLPGFTPSRGLRQGDPLSPYLFVLCMEVLGQKITKAVESQQWRPVNLSRQGPKVSHVFVADDLLLFGEASFSQARFMEYILADFCWFSGQRVNQGKSRVWFSPNTPLYLKNAICTEFGILPTAALGSYLGVPLVHGKLKGMHYKFLVEKVEKRLAGWKIRFLSKASRTLLIKTTLMALPIYSMNTTAIPKSTTNQLERLCRHFLWGETPRLRRQHTVSWEKICQDRNLRGLGIPRLADSNRAMLTKLLWRMIKQPAELSSRILTAKYGDWRSLLL